MTISSLIVVKNIQSLKDPAHIYETVPTLRLLLRKKMHQLSEVHNHVDKSGENTKSKVKMRTLQENNVYSHLSDVSVALKSVQGY